MLSRFPSACSEDISVCACVFSVFLVSLMLVVRISVSVSVYSVCYLDFLVLLVVRISVSVPVYSVCF